MRPLLLDTNAYTAYKLGDAAIIEIIQQVEIIAISTIVLGELLGGFAKGNKNQQNRADLQQFLSSSRVRIYPVTADTANFYAHVYSTLYNKGKPIPANDMWIAAQALEHGCILCSYDKHFNAIENLIVVTHVNQFEL